MVGASFDTAKAAIARRLGQPLKQCEKGDGLRTCGTEIAEKKTLTLMAEDNPRSTKTLVGCYYFYAK
ncbi:hypothetical protein D3C83_183460 [compost metagenome]